MAYRTAVHFCALPTCHCLLVPGVFRDPGLLKKERPSLSVWPLPEVGSTAGKGDVPTQKPGEVFSVGQEPLRAAAQEEAVLLEAGVLL